MAEKPGTPKLPMGAMKYWKEREEDCGYNGRKLEKSKAIHGLL